MIEVGQDVGAPLGQGPGQLGDLLQPVGDGLPQGVDEPLHQVLSQARAVSPVGLDQALVDAPGGLDRSVVLTGEQNLETPGLGVDEQAGSGVQGAPGREAGSIRASARLSDLTPPELHEGRDPLAEGWVYSTGSGGSCSTHNPQPVHPHPRAVDRSEEDPAQIIVEP